MLRWLRREGKSPQAFHTARLICTSTAPAREPVEPAQLASPYLAPIASECARCQRFWFDGSGVQCQECRYTLCPDCAADQPRCPDCEEPLGKPVRATGRPRGLPAVTRTEKLESVLVLWRTAAPTTAEIERLLDFACTWQDRRGAWVITHRDEQLCRATGEACIAEYEYRGWLRPGAQGRMRVARGGADRLLFIVASAAE